jgi:opacity protein-like surface antigen
MSSDLMQQIESWSILNKGILILMKKILLVSFCLSLYLSLPAFAVTSSQTKLTDGSPSRFSVGAYGGYGVVNGGYHQDGQVAQSRLAIGIRAAQYKKLTFGAEAGVQSGNAMRLDASSALMAAAGCLPIDSTLKPLLDLLVTVKTRIDPSYPIFAVLKGGIAYRQLVLSGRSSSRDGLRRVNGELQAGLVFNLTDHAALATFYQGIYSGTNAGLNLDSASDVTIRRIPTQQAVFLGFEYSI